ncbi:hypothetical protein LSAT2_003189, partial [Lamellibrachia satsuma]
MTSLVVRFVLICYFIHSACRLVDANPIHSTSVTSPPSDSSGNDTAGHAHEEHEVHRYHVAMVDFARIAGPFVVTGWILLASIAKIGKQFK